MLPLLLIVVVARADPVDLAALVRPVPVVEVPVGPPVDLGCALPEACPGEAERACPTSDPTGSDPIWKRCAARARGPS
jgi:hypothetical protein